MAAVSSNEIIEQLIPFLCIENDPRHENRFRVTLGAPARKTFSIVDDVSLNDATTIRDELTERLAVILAFIQERLGLPQPPPPESFRRKLARQLASLAVFEAGRAENGESFRSPEAHDYAAHIIREVALGLLLDRTVSEL